MSCLRVYVIGGFLGSGKTTLLKRLLAHELERGVKPAVLMNEFGEMGPRPRPSSGASTRSS